MKQLPPTLAAAIIDVNRSLDFAVGSLTKEQAALLEMDNADVADVLRTLEALKTATIHIGQLLARKRA